jgi:ribosomal protein S18 acetylase RimI-like enzyme
MNKTPGVRFRDIDWPRDGEALTSFEATFTTDRIYRLEIGDLAAEFVEEELSEPLTKRYDVSGIRTAVEESGFALAAEIDGEIAAFMTVKFESWNRRMWITHLYVANEYKNRGIGSKLVNEALAFVKRKNARGLWLETQNFNYPAIRFYAKLGFRFCGFDGSLYDPALVPGETAMYFSRNV